MTDTDYLPEDEIPAGCYDMEHWLIAQGKDPLPDPFDGFAGFAGGGECEKTFFSLAPFAPPAGDRLPPFPEIYLSETVWDMTAAVSESLQVAGDMAAACMIAAPAIGIQKKFIVIPKPDWKEQTGVYILVTAPPSERKSAVISIAMAPVYEYEREENQRRQPLVDEYQARKDTLQQRIEAMKKAVSSISGPKKNTVQVAMEDVLEVQRELRQLESDAINYISLTTGDTTMEALAVKMAANDEKMALVSSEGGIFKTLAGLYNNGMKNIDLILQSYSGDPVEIDRISRPSIKLQSPIMTILLMIQPVVLEEIMKDKEFLGRGLDARFLYVVSKSPVGHRKYNTEAIPEAVKEAYNAMMQRLLAIPDTGTPREIYLSPEAQAESESIHNWIEPRLKGDLEHIADWAGKLHGKIIRIAGILHVCEYFEEADKVPISLDTMQRARKLGEYFLEHALVAYQIMGLGDDDATRDAKYILKRLDSTGKMEISKRDLYQLCKDKTGFETVDKMEPGLEVLVKRGYIRIDKHPRPQNLQNRQKGGRPRSPMIYVNPEYIERKQKKL